MRVSELSIFLRSSGILVACLLMIFSCYPLRSFPEFEERWFLRGSGRGEVEGAAFHLAPQAGGLRFRLRIPAEALSE